MASGLYPSGATKLITGVIDVDTDNLTPALMLTTYSYSAAHDFWDDVTASEVADGTTTYLASVSVASGVMDATDYTFTTVSGSAIGFIILREYDAVDASSALLCKIEVTSTTPNGNDIDIVWDSGANKIFSLSLAS